MRGAGWAGKDHGEHTCLEHTLLHDMCSETSDKAYLSRHSNISKPMSYFLQACICNKHFTSRVLRSQLPVQCLTAFLRLHHFWLGVAAVAQQEPTAVRGRDWSELPMRHNRLLTTTTRL